MLGSGDIQLQTELQVIYSELVALRNENKLIPGTSYRITDYVTTVAGLDLVKSANHPFDIIVTAISSNELSEDAKAILHEGDEYFAKCQLSAWELKYCLDNDTNRFTWADTENGKGVVWYMKDESDNSAYYDFKGVQVRESKTSNDWYYTFSVYYTDTQEDFSVAKYDYNGKGCINNTIDIQHLRNSYNRITINYNTIIADARSTDEVVNPENYYWRSIHNHIGTCCSHIKVDKSCTNVKFGNYCSYINFNTASNISFGDQNQYIYFNNMDDTVFGPYISNFKFIKEDGSYANVASSRIESNFNSGYYISIKCANTLRNLHIKAGVANGKTQTIEIDKCGNYTTTIERSATTGEVIVSKSGNNTGIDTSNLIVNNLIDGGIDKALSAEMGKELAERGKAMTETIFGYGESIGYIADVMATKEDLSEYAKSADVITAEPAEGDGEEVEDYVLMKSDVEHIIPHVVDQTDSVATIQPNVLNVWGEVESLDITLAEPTDNTIVNEYMAQFTSGATATTLTLPNTIKWMAAPNIQTNKTYQLSVINNLGVIGEFSHE